MAAKNDRKDIKRMADSLHSGFLMSVVDYLFSENAAITRRSLKRVKEFFELFEQEDFSAERGREVTYLVIRRLIAARVDGGIRSRDLLEQSCLEGSSFEEEANEVLNDVKEIRNEDVENVDRTVAARLKYASFAPMASELSNLILDYQAGEFGSLGLAGFLEQRLEPIVASAASELRRIKVLDRASSFDFNLTEESMLSAFDKTYELRTSGGSSIWTGIQWLNQMLGGNGWEAPRVYTILGASGKWKSGFLFNAAMWSRMYNQRIDCFDKTKKPCTLYVTMENDIPETIERFYSYALDEGCSEGNDIRDVDDIEDLVGQLVAEHLGDSGDEEGYQVFLKYRPNRSIDCNDLEAMIEELEADGWEVKFLVVDYIARLRSITREIEERFRLAEIVNQLKTLAVGHQVPVLTAGQLNRTAMAVIEEMQQKGHPNIGKFLQGSHVGEAWGIFQNSDLCIVGNPEDVITKRGREKKYYTFTRVKLRGREKGLWYFAHPFVAGNDMRLVEDVEGDPASLPNLMDSSSESSLTEEERSIVNEKGKSRNKPKTKDRRKKKGDPPKEGEPPKQFKSENPPF